MSPLPRARTAAEAPTLLDALARAPAAAALVIGALGQKDRGALRLVHTQLQDAVGEVVTKLSGVLYVRVRPPTARRWPRLKELSLSRPSLAALEALGSGTWVHLRALCLEHPDQSHFVLNAPSARLLVAALRRMPALRSLELCSLKLQDMLLSNAAAGELFCASSAEAVRQLRTLRLTDVSLTPEMARMIAATGWRLEELDLYYNSALGPAGAAALLAAPTFALRRLALGACNLDAANFLALANASWPLEELDLSHNDFSGAAAGPALAALSKHVGLRKLVLSCCSLSAASFKALVEATWPALTLLSAHDAKVEFAGPHALGAAAAFAGFPALEALRMAGVVLGAAGARLLASRRWPCLRELHLFNTQLGDAGVAALARGTWPALTYLNLCANGLTAPPDFEDAPALVEYHADVRDHEDSDPETEGEPE